MTKTDIACGHTKTALCARGVNIGCKMITFSHLNSSEFNDKFKDNFMQDEVLFYCYQLTIKQLIKPSDFSLKEAATGGVL